MWRTHWQAHDNHKLLALARVPHIVLPAPSTITLNSTGGSSSMFNEGTQTPGIYRIQNISTETYLDIEVPSRDVCCRPAKDLGEGRGLVRRLRSSVIYASDD